MLEMAGDGLLLQGEADDGLGVGVELRVLDIQLVVQQAKKGGLRERSLEWGQANKFGPDLVGEAGVQQVLGGADQSRQEHSPPTKGSVVGDSWAGTAGDQVTAGANGVLGSEAVDDGKLNHCLGDLGATEEFRDVVVKCLAGEVGARAEACPPDDLYGHDREIDEAAGQGVGLQVGDAFYFSLVLHHLEAMADGLLERGDFGRALFAPVACFLGHRLLGSRVHQVTDRDSCVWRVAGGV